MMNIWYADLDLSAVCYVGPKPTSFPKGKNPFPVKPPTPSVTLFLHHLTRPFMLRWRWWEARKIRRENLMRYGQR
jgi:hypothetical protein